MGKKRIFDVLLLVIPAIAIILISVFYSEEAFDTPTQTFEKKVEDAYQPIIKYGIVVDSLLTYSDKIKKNQNLSDILTKFDVSYQSIDLLVKRSKGIFDVRKIRSGNKYVIFSEGDSLSQNIQYFIYEESATDYVVFDLRDSIHVHRGQKEVETRIATTYGSIESSLWNALKAQNSNPFLAVVMSEVYAWEIDFFGIQKGDAFRVKYEELYVEDQKIGVGKILSARFDHINNPYYAFYYVQDSVGDYFDDEGSSLRRTFLKAPLRYSRISSGYSNNRMHPILKVRRPHHGVDYAAPSGTPVQTIGDGIVIYAGRKGAAGKMIKIKHNGTYSSAYLHLSRYGKGIKKGAKVKQGQIIGYVGSTGRSTGPHLDFRVYRNGSAINPLRMKSPPANPVDSVNLEGYLNFIYNDKALIDNLGKADALKDTIQN